MGGQHHAQRHALVPVQAQSVQLAVGTGQEHLREVASQTHHDGLGLGVAHAAIELQGFDAAVGRDHQTGVQKAGVLNAVGGHAAQRGLDDLLHGAAVDLGRDHRRGRIRAHATGVGALVAVEQAFVVLAGGQGQGALAVTQHDEAGLFAGQKLFDHDTRTTGVVRHA